VAADAEAARIFCLKGGDPDGATAWAPAFARVDDVTIAVGGGGDAGRAVALRDAVATALQTGDLPLRHRTHRRGRVALVGGGPGDPGLMPTRGRRLLAEADVVVLDRLAPQAVLAELPEDVEIIDVGKQPDHHPIPQDDINALLIDRARRGKVVVRLKGGDPYVFGRGGEELIACREAGVEVEVVPGVPSAIAVAAAAGLPGLPPGGGHPAEPPRGGARLLGRHGARGARRAAPPRRPHDRAADGRQAPASDRE